MIDWLSDQWTVDLLQAEATAEPPAAEEGKLEGKKEEEEVDIDLDDPETEKAALKIQAGFRGYKTRKEISQGWRGFSSRGFHPGFLRFSSC